MSILERAKAHFSKHDTIEITVPEWEDENGDPTILYSKPMTLGDRRKLLKFAKEDNIEFVARLIILKAMDKDGNQAFDLGDKIHLINSVDPDVLDRIATQITKATSVEQYEGN
jgi:hypothetical protein